jgi:rod shape determining protein RodA
MFDRRLARYFDWGLLGLTMLIGAFGLITLYSAVTTDASSAQRILYYKQMIWFAVGLSCMIVCFLINYKVFERWAIPIYIGCNLLLAAVLWIGRYAGGSRRWLSLGPVSLQPSELIKIALILVLARYFSKVINAGGLTLRELVQPMLLTAVPFGLIVVQPDLGTAGLLALIAVSITIFAKIERRSLAAIVALGAAVVPMVWFVLKDYQKQRILTLLDPDRDPLGSGYHIIQSKIAIGSGMLSGKGFLHGTQNALSFLPEQHTDFIFSVLAEEWGFLGASAVIVCFLLLIVYGLTIAQRCRDPFGTILCVGITALIFWQVFINVGMVMGLLPIVGVPLPFVSYGGSSVVTTLIGIGLLLNVSMRRFVIP